MTQAARPKKNNLPAVLLTFGFVLGAAAFVGYRTVTYKSANIHHHANFSLFVDGQRDEFKSFTFYEEIQSCDSHEIDNPKTRVHMHNSVPGEVHVHDSGVTWGHFFANLGYGLSDKALKTDGSVLVDSANKKLRFILNGQQVETIANRAIGSEDALLIDYGSESLDALLARANQIPRTAKQLNNQNDPATCSGAAQLTLIKRLKIVLGIEDASR